MPEKGEDKPQAKGLVSGLMDMITGSGEGQKAATFPVTLICVGIIVLIISIFGIRMAFAKRKAAKLAAKIRKVEEEKVQAEEGVKLAENSTARVSARAEVKALTKEILGLKARMAKRSADHLKEVKELDSVTSWDDIVIIDARENP